MKKKRIAIFASGGGSNAKKIIEHLHDHAAMKVALIVSNKPKAGVLKIAASSHIPTLLLSRENFYEKQLFGQKLLDQNIDFIVLAGFLWLIPEYLVKVFPNRIVNIHPALLPKYGGKGMYGKYVHQAVKAAGEKETGPTIHYVNEHYDEGNIIFQVSCSLNEEDTPESIAGKVLELEHQYYQKIVESLVQALPA